MPQNTLVCRYCGEVIDKEALFCPECGKAVLEKRRIRYCQYCGNLLNDDGICDNCNDIEEYEDAIDSGDEWDEDDYDEWDDDEDDEYDDEDDEYESLTLLERLMFFALPSWIKLDTTFIIIFLLLFLITFYVFYM